MSNLSRFISEDPEDEYERRLRLEGEGVDPADIVRQWRDPGITLAPAARDTRMHTNGGGALAMVDKRQDQATDRATAAGSLGNADTTARRIENTQNQWLSGGPDTPPELAKQTEQQASFGDRAFSYHGDEPVPQKTPDAPPTKPPGPDSPSTQYKDPASKFISDASGARQKAYDEDWDPSGKYKKFRIETTSQRTARREAQQRDLYQSKQEGVEAYERARQMQPRMIGTQTFRTAEGKKQIYGTWNDGTSKFLMDGLDEAAEKGTLVPGKNDTLGRVMPGSNIVERMMTPSPGAPLASSTGVSTLQGPGTAAAQAPWLTPEKDYTLGYGQTRINAATGEVEAEGKDRPVRPVGVSTPSSKISPEVAAKARAAGSAAAAAYRPARGETPTQTLANRKAAGDAAAARVITGEAALPAAAEGEKRIQREGFSWSPE